MHHKTITLLWCSKQIKQYNSYNKPSSDRVYNELNRLNKCKFKIGSCTSSIMFTMLLALTRFSRFTNIMAAYITISDTSINNCLRKLVVKNSTPYDNIIMTMTDDLHRKDVNDSEMHTKQFFFLASLWENVNQVIFLTFLNLLFLEKKVYI